VTTLKDIASIVGVHPSTVSYVLNGKGDRIGVRPERAARILEVAQRLGYRPNAAAVLRPWSWAMSGALTICRPSCRPSC